MKNYSISIDGRTMAYNKTANKSIDIARQTAKKIKRYQVVSVDKVNDHGKPIETVFITNGETR